MPPVEVAADGSNAFTVIDHERENVTRAGAGRPVPRHVNVVKPLSHAAPSHHSLLDPQFSRALDFKLRRLREKEMLRANLMRPTRQRLRTSPLAASDPSIGSEELSTNGSLKNSSQPCLDAPERDRWPPRAEPSGRRGRPRPAPVCEDGDKPRFVTTVKSGQFLLPPPEIARILGLETLYPSRESDKFVYSYASKPKAVASRCKRSISERNSQSNLPNSGHTSAATPQVGAAFSGVRALVAGVVGVRRLAGPRASGGAARAHCANLMHDRRVARGSTLAAHPHAAGDGAESAAARAVRTRRRALARRAAAARLRPGTPPAAPGRKHHPVQTEYYLEELFDKGVELEVGVQTDLFADRPATPAYVPASTGADVATQIYPGDLFDFDLEVQSILEVLVGKTTEQALAEVAQEEELATLREQQRRYCELRDAELAERQRLAAQDLRLHQEKERRVAEARVAQVAATEARERAAAAVLVQGYVAELLPAVLAGLRDQGYLMERIERGVDEEFMPWLVEEVSREIEFIITSRDVIIEIVRDVVEARAALYRDAGSPRPAPAPADSDTPPAEEEPEPEE